MGASVVAIMIRKERDVVEQFLSSRATSESRAQSLGELHLENNVALRRLENRAVVRQTAQGTYYLDEPSWKAMRASRQRRIILLVILLLAVVLPIGLMSIRTGDRRAPEGEIAQ